MITKTITYTDYNGEENTEKFLFNLTKAELMEMQVSKKGGMDKFIERIVEEKDAKNLVGYFKEIILLSYGIKSDDGKRFIKNDEVRDEFVQSPAYSELFMELATDADKAAEFINGVIPQSMLNEIEKMQEKGELPKTVAPSNK